MASSQHSSAEWTLKSTIKKYRDSEYKFVISEGLKCLFCTLILLDPVQTDCGCRYCRSCIEKYLKDGAKRCLGDSEECECTIKGFITDKATNKEISLTVVKCLNKDCEFKDSLKNISAHFDNCQFRIVTCVLCGLSYIGRDEKKHLEVDCLMRERECTFCHGKFTHQEYDSIHLNVEHEELCRKYVSTCPYQCEVTEEVNIVLHRQFCRNKPMECPYKSLGCKVVIDSGKMAEHLQTELKGHNVTLVAEIDKLKETVKELKEQMKSLNDVNQSLKTKNNLLKVDFDNRCAQLEKSTKTTSSSFSGRNETVFRNGKYIWKISNYTKLKTDAMKGLNISLTSDSFYTSEFGYKMCLKIYPFGDGVGKGTHLSVFFVLMKGDFDDLQSWPFKNKVTLTLLEDFSKTTNHCDTFKPDARSICYQKPEDEYNIASGSPKFIALTELSRFLRNDTLYLQIVVLA